jgi:hypothetical protein
MFPLMSNTREYPKPHEIFTIRFPLRIPETSIYCGVEMIVVVPSPSSPY